jgi:hypothetical protein
MESRRSRERPKGKAVSIFTAVVVSSLLSSTAVYLYMSAQPAQTVQIAPASNLELAAPGAIEPKEITKYVFLKESGEFVAERRVEESERLDIDTDEDDKPGLDVSESILQSAYYDSPYTPMGAQRSGNQDGTLPAWNGSIYGLPQGFSYAGDGSPYPNVYALEAPLFKINASDLKTSNLKTSDLNTYEPLVTEGLQALLHAYPDTFEMHVYPSHRDFRYDDLIIARSHWNARFTYLNEEATPQRYTGGIPFIQPKSAIEVMWNARLSQPNASVEGLFDDVARYPDGSMDKLPQTLIADYPFADPDNAVGKDETEIGPYIYLKHLSVQAPDRQKGQMSMYLEPLDRLASKAQSYIFIPGSRRVRRAPSMSQDTPCGPGGLMTLDDHMGFTGSLQTYDWQLKGKREAYIPYHAYTFDHHRTPYDELLLGRHVNPKYQRFERHRVWVVEATLKPEKRHIYAKRRFYIDEDSWQIVLTEAFDKNDQLWRVGILNTVYDYGLKAYVARAQVFYDLINGSYVATRLVNEQGQPSLQGKPKGRQYYTPGNLRKMSNR